MIGKVAEVIAIICVPVVLGMVVRARSPRFAKRVEKPMRVISALVLVVFVAASIAKERDALGLGFAEVGVSVVVFNVLSLALGYAVSRAAAAGAPGPVAGVAGQAVGGQEAKCGVARKAWAHSHRLRRG